MSRLAVLRKVIFAVRSIRALFFSWVIGIVVLVIGHNFLTEFNSADTFKVRLNPMSIAMYLAGVKGVGVELHVPDFAPVYEFYGALGFSETFREHGEGPNNYLMMSLGQLTLRFWPGNQSVYEHSFFGRYPKEFPLGKGVEIVLPISDLDDLYRKAIESSAITEEQIVNQLCTQPWGLRDFRLCDPFGYYLRFTEYELT